MSDFDRAEGGGYSDDEPWYGVRCHFYSPGTPSERANFEERITLWRADSMDHAIERAEEEAVDYAKTVGVRYLAACSVFHLGEDGFGVDGLEVFSEMRWSDLSPDDYLDRFFFTGAENSADGSPSSYQSSNGPDGA